MSESSPRPRVPRQTLLLALGAAVAALLVYLLWPAAVKPGAPSNPPREQRKQAAVEGKEAAAPGALDVELGALQQPPPKPEEAARNPFRFYVKPPPPPPAAPRSLQPGEKGYVAPPPPPRIPKPGDPDYVPPPPPQIPLKFIGTVEKAGRKVAIFVSSDGRGLPVYASEGETILGQYRLVRIGVESATLEYLDGRGRQTIPMRGDTR